jgi:hypothetical protein
MITNRQLQDKSRDALDALVSKNSPPEIFVRSGHLVRWRTDEKGRPFIEPLTEPALRNRLTEVADFFKITNFGQTAADPPLNVVKDILAQKAWTLPGLEAIVEVPVVRPDGTILDRRGYDPFTKLVYQPARGLRVPSIPSSPSGGEVAKARELIEEVIGDFPFDGPASRANALGALITPIVRPVIVGPAPLALLDAPQQGTGKSLLASVIAVLATGRPAAMMAASDSDEEWRKRITATLASGATVITLDNLAGRLESASLASALTSVEWQDRVLGVSKMVSLPNRATWLATGNNIRLGGDMQRRCYWVRLDAQSGEPWRRGAFKHLNLLEWVRENRGDVLAALLTLARAWYAAGRPATTGTPILGSFEGWCRTVGGILAHAGVGEFLGNLDGLYGSADDEAAEWQAFLSALADKYRDGLFTGADVMSDLEYNSTLRDCLPEELAEAFGRQGVSFARRLGKALSARVGRRYGPESLHVVKAGTVQHAQQWRVIKEKAGCSTASL